MPRGLGRGRGVGVLGVMGDISNQENMALQPRALIYWPTPTYPHSDIVSIPRG